MRMRLAPKQGGVEAHTQGGEGSHQELFAGGRRGEAGSDQW